MTIECKDCKEKQRIIKTLQRKLNFEREINEVEIKRVILYHIQKATDEQVIKALQDLFKDIYVVPDDIFERETISTLLANTEVQRRLINGS